MDCFQMHDKYRYDFHHFTTTAMHTSIATTLLRSFTQKGVIEKATGSHKSSRYALFSWCGLAIKFISFSDQGLGTVLVTLEDMRASAWRYAHREGRPSHLLQSNSYFILYSVDRNEKI